MDFGTLESVFNHLSQDSLKTEMEYILILFYLTIFISCCYFLTSSKKLIENNSDFKLFNIFKDLNFLLFFKDIVSILSFIGTIFLLNNFFVKIYTPWILFFFNLSLLIPLYILTCGIFKKDIIRKNIVVIKNKLKKFFHLIFTHVIKLNDEDEDLGYKVERLYKEIILYKLKKGIQAFLIFFFILVLTIVYNNFLPFTDIVFIYLMLSECLFFVISILLIITNKKDARKSTTLITAFKIFVKFILNAMISFEINYMIGITFYQDSKYLSTIFPKFVYVTFLTLSLGIWLISSHESIKN